MVSAATRSRRNRRLVRTASSTAVTSEPSATVLVAPAVSTARSRAAAARSAASRSSPSDRSRPSRLYRRIVPLCATYQASPSVFSASGAPSVSSTASRIRRAVVTSAPSTSRYQAVVRRGGGDPQELGLPLLPGTPQPAQPGQLAAFQSAPDEHRPQQVALQRGQVLLGGHRGHLAGLVGQVGVAELTGQRVRDREQGLHERHVRRVAALTGQRQVPGGRELAPGARCASSSTPARSGAARRASPCAER